MAVVYDNLVIIANTQIGDIVGKLLGIRQHMGQVTLGRTLIDVKKHSAGDMAASIFELGITASRRQVPRRIH